MLQYPMSMVLVIIEGHTAVQMGELVYALPGCRNNLYAQPAEVRDNAWFVRTRPIHSKWQFLKAILLDCYDPLLIQNRGRKGLIAISCGYTFHRPGSRQSWAELVDR
jgi:acetone carboxylase gamma subunit